MRKEKTKNIKRKYFLPYLRTQVDEAEKKSIVLKDGLGARVKVDVLISKLNI